jgi:hypothetical protein
MKLISKCIFDLRLSREDDLRFWHSQLIRIWSNDFNFERLWQQINAAVGLFAGLRLEQWNQSLWR